MTPAMQAVVDAAIRKAYGGKRRIEWKEDVYKRQLYKVSTPAFQETPEASKLIRRYNARVVDVYKRQISNKV